MAIKIAAIAGFIAVIGFGVYFFWLSPASAPIVQIPIPPTPEQPPEPFITPPVKPGSFFAEAPITRSLPPGFEFQTIGEEEGMVETLKINSEAAEIEEQALRELKAIGINVSSINELPEVKWPTLQETIAMSEIEISSGQKEADIFVQNLTKSFVASGLIDSSEQKEALIAAREASKFLNQITLENTSELDAALNFSKNYIDSLAKQGLLTPEEKQTALEAAESSAALSIGSQSNVLGPFQNLPN